MSEEENGSFAADGSPVPGACNTLGEFIRRIEGGQFDADAHTALSDLSAALTEHAWSNGGKSSGKMAITLDFKREGMVTTISAKYKITSPEPNRAKTVMWNTEDNRFTPFDPQQRQLFGVRDVTGETRERRAI